MAEQLLTRLENAVMRLENLAGTGQAASEKEPLWIAAFEEEYLKKVMVDFKSASHATEASEIIQASDLFVQVNHVLLELIRKSQSSPKPITSPELQTFLLPVSSLMQKLQPDNRSDFFPNQKAIAEAMNIVLILTSPSPPSHLQSILEASDFHLIKVLRKKVNTETVWVKQLKTCIQWLVTWATDYCKFGIVWNKNPTLSKSVGLPISKAKAPGPPPPPPAPGAGTSAPTTTSGGFGEVLKQLETGGFSLKKTTKTEKAIEAGIPMDIEKPPAKRPFAGRKCEAKVTLERDCWYVEGQWEESVQVKETTMKQSVYIGKSGKSTIAISGKIKTISIDGCESLNVVVDSVISTIEIVNSKKMNLQITGNVPSVSVDKTDGLQIYLSEASVNLDLITAKSSEINLNVPVGEGDWKELVVPEQFVHKIQNKKVTSRVSDLYG